MDQSKSGLRRSKILDYIKLHGKISVQELIQEFNCSEATARRDLDWLDQSGKVIRTIGGAVYEGNLRQEPAEISFRDKQFSLREEKEKIAAIAASLVQAGDVVCLTGGSTTFFIARALKNHSRITIVTNAVNIAAELAGAEGVRVVVIGGVMRTGSYELIGPLAESVVRQVNVTKMFLGVDGVSREHGFTMHSELESSIAQQLIMRSSEVYPVFDDSKLAKSALFTIIPLSKATGIITNKQPEPWLEAACVEQQVKIYTGE